MKTCVYKPNKHQGFCSIFNCILCLIDYCLQHHFIPEVDLSECQYNTRQDPSFLDELFHIMPLFSTENEGSPCSQLPSDHGKETFTISDEGIPRVLIEDPSFEFPVMMFNNFPDSTESRRRLYQLTRFLRFNEEILDEVNSFWDHSCVGPIVGVHMRAADYNLYEFAHMLRNPELLKRTRKYSPKVYDFALAAKKFLHQYPDGKALIATDSATAYSTIRFFAFLRGRMLRYPSTFMKDGGKPEFRVRDAGGDGFKLAKEILTEVLLLSRCGHFVSSYSNVAATVLILNPELSHENISSWIRK